MIVTNKLAITVFPYESTLTALQMAFTVLVLVAAWPTLHVGSLHDALRWSLVAPCFAGMLLTSMLALKHCTMTLVIVVRAMSPMFALMAEMNRSSVLHVNRQMILSIFIMVLGALLYTKDLEFRHLVGVGWIAVNTCFSVLTRLLQRKMLAADQSQSGTGPKRNPVDISKSGCSLINNALGLLPLLVTAYFTGEGGEVHSAPAALMSLTQRETNLMVISCVVAVGISYTNIWCQSLISATSMLILVNANRWGRSFFRRTQD
ncbi:GDP-fucose transporter 1 (GDP-mannose transporter GONST4) (Protein GOLGI NUCLEOTIDE SUGAR TRANSPORTER 4) [Durusdinium trenchii]|uniref:GDP-fucose transporter 1 (GDP-mannose transporter GONST4) (Protein GOLGI NUCLEOTIDE SUGAR TRANSPORTER 4) n=1 Tax=Durusdinium trenchii TaxID=1381693 RepID=A0ABP0PZD3_9DINO